MQLHLPRPSSTSSRVVMTLAAMVLLAVTLTFTQGCETSTSVNSLTDIRSAYDAQNYNKAYHLGARMSAYEQGPAAQQAAYMAGMSAYKLGRSTEAIQQLSSAAQSSDKGMAGDALATMGLLYARQNNHTRAAQAFLAAAGRLQEQGRANAYFFAAVSEQKIGHWALARTHLSLARNDSRDTNFKQQVDDQLAVTGYSLQVGAFADDDNANAAAAKWSKRVGDLHIGWPRLVRQTTSDGKTVTTVQIGQFSSYTTALMARKEIGDSEAIVVPLR